MQFLASQALGSPGTMFIGLGALAVRVSTLTLAPGRQGCT